MQSAPDEATLLEAVAGFLEQTLMPSVTDPALGFRVRIAAHVLGGLARELRLGEDHDRAELARLATLLEQPVPAVDGTGSRREAIRAWEALLAERLRQGAWEEEGLARVRTALRETLAARLSETNPRFDTAAVLPEEEG